MRDFEDEKLEQHIALLRSTAEEVVAAAPGARLEFEVEHQYPNLLRYLERTPQVVEVAERAVRAEGLEPVRKPIRGGTDGCLLSAAGLPTPNLFTGGHEYHSLREWASLQDMASRGRGRRAPRGRMGTDTMDFDLSDDHELIRRTVRDFAEGEVAPVAEELDRTKSFPYEIVRKLGDLGLMGIPFPEEYGGAGADSLAYALAVEELTRVDSSVAITMCAHTSLGTQPIYLFGSEEQKREWLPELTSGRRLGAFGLTEPEAGLATPATSRTRARLDDGEWVIDGAKQFITNAGHRDLGDGLHHRAHRRRTRSPT